MRFSDVQVGQTFIVPSLSSHRAYTKIEDAKWINLDDLPVNSVGFTPREMRGCLYHFMPSSYVEVLEQFEQC